MKPLASSAVSRHVAAFLGATRRYFARLVTPATVDPTPVRS